MSEWIEGQLPRLMRQAVQVEYRNGMREISLCPACSPRFAQSDIVHYRMLPPEIKTAYAKFWREKMSRCDPSEVAPKSKCHKWDMVVMGGDGEGSTNYHLCLHCFQPCDPL